MHGAFLASLAIIIFVVARASNILDRLLSPVVDCFNRESAERLAELQIAPDTRARIEELAQKANEGQLSDVERGEYAEYVQAMDWIAILQSKARESLARRPTA
jgi:hypothetical protein